MATHYKYIAFGFERYLCHVWLDVPWICPIVRGLSSRSVPASMSNLAARVARNLFDKPSNQPIHVSNTIVIILAIVIIEIEEH